MATDWNDPNHPALQQLAQSDPSQVSSADAQQALRDLHQQMTPEQLQPVLQQFYASLTPEQRAAVASQFHQELSQAAPTNEATQQVVAKIDPQNATPEQVAEMHTHAHAFHPNTLEKVAIGTAGAAAVGGLAILAAKHFTKKA